MCETEYYIQSINIRSYIWYTDDLSIYQILYRQNKEEQFLGFITWMIINGTHVSINITFY